MKKVFNIFMGFLVVLAITLIYFFAIKGGITGAVVSEDVAKYIGQHSVVYVQLGCHACKTQENLFGNSWKYITSVDCIYNSQQCIDAGITETPTWVINGKKYTGVQTIEKLKELTGYS